MNVLWVVDEAAGRCVPVGRGAAAAASRTCCCRSRCCWLLRRGDWAELIGRALELKAADVGQRPIAAALGVSRSTVRGWLARFADLAEDVRAHLVRWALWLDPGLVRLEPAGSPLADAVAAVAAAGGAAGEQLGIGCRWAFASAATGGRLLCNTSSPFPGPWMR